MFVTQSAHQGSCFPLRGMISAASRQGRLGAPWKGAISKTIDALVVTCFCWLRLGRWILHLDQTARQFSASCA
jgi:hypothetical protein